MVKLTNIKKNSHYTKVTHMYCLSKQMNPYYDYLALITNLWHLFPLTIMHINNL
jgi:hypothetical protein